MRVSLLKCLAVLLMLGMMLTHTKPAEAHNLSKPQYQASYQDHGTPAASGWKTEVSIAVFPASGNDDCGGGCCSMAAACCSMATLNNHSIDFPFVPAAFEFHAWSDDLPQGPPYTLLRPPKFSV
ncbi:MAG: hypothetical protein PSY14_03475 [bacterium]|nr:hypothetical protein [bacterium]